MVEHSGHEWPPEAATQYGYAQCGRCQVFAYDGGALEPCPNPVPRKNSIDTAFDRLKEFQGFGAIDRMFRPKG
jgi:hypothetical protein